MTPILFYGVPSGCSFGSIVALEWLGKPYRLSRIDMPSVVQSDDYRRINPVGETPSLLTEDGRILSESLAILNHIGAQATEEGLAFKQGTAGFDRLNQTLAYLNTSFFNSFSPLWYSLEHEMAPPAKQALRAYGAANVAKVHEQLEKMLGEGPGSSVTSARWLTLISSALRAGRNITTWSSARTIRPCRNCSSGSRTIRR